jgi:cell division protein FtsB
MTTAENILVIFLSAALAVFLLLAILISIQILKLTRILRDIAERAERVVSSAEAVGRIFRKSSAPVSLVQFVRSVSDIVAEHKQKKEEK